MYIYNIYIYIDRYIDIDIYAYRTDIKTVLYIQFYLHE